jgi:hypothetical protein
MNDKAGSMGAGAAWGIAIGASALAGAMSFLISSTGITWLISLVVLLAGGWATVFLTKATAGKGILAFLAGAVVASIIAYFGFKSMMTSAMAEASGEMQKAMGDLTKQGKATEAQVQQASAMIQGGLGAAAGGLAGFVTFIRVFLLGMIGCFIGSSMKKSALGAAGGSVAKAA